MVPAYRLFSYTGDPIDNPEDGKPHVMFSTVIPANTLAVDGAMLEVLAHGGMDDDATPKTLTAMIGNVAATTWVLDLNNDTWLIRWNFVRKNAAGSLLRPKFSATACYEPPSMPLNSNGIVHIGSANPVAIPTGWSVDQRLQLTAVGPINGLSFTVMVFP